MVSDATFWLTIPGAWFGYHGRLLLGFNLVGLTLAALFYGLMASWMRRVLRCKRMRHWWLLAPVTVLGTVAPVALSLSWQLRNP